MIENKDFISLLVTIDLGILAAALTLLAIYPAIAASIDASRLGASARNVIGHEVRRRSIFRWLGVAAAASFLGLLTLMGAATMGFAVVASPAETATICCLPAPKARAVVEIWMSRISALASFISVLGVGRAGWAIFRLTRDFA